MKKIITSLILFTSFFSYGFTKSEWNNFIVDSIETKSDLSWNYDVKKLKTYSKMSKDSDIIILEEIAKGDDYQLSQGAKYLLSLQGNKTNKFFIENYILEDDFKNGLYYLNANYINTSDKSSFWQEVKNKEIESKSIVNDYFSECKNFKDVNLLGGKNFELESYDDFFEKRSLIENYTHLDLMFLELDLIDVAYPISITIYSDRYVINKEDEELCADPNKNVDYQYLQKIAAIYKQYQKTDSLTLLCNEFKDNELLKSRFSYYCIKTE